MRMCNNTSTHQYTHTLTRTHAACADDDDDDAKEVGAQEREKEKEEKAAQEEALATGMKFETGCACKMAQTCATVANGGKQQIKRQFFSDSATGAQRGRNRAVNANEMGRNIRKKHKEGKLLFRKYSEIQMIHDI